MFKVILFIVLAFSQSVVVAQNDGPVPYMQRLTDQEQMLSKNYLSYMSSVAHGSKARKMEKRRAELITSVKEALKESAKIRPYKGDVALRDAFRGYWNVLLSVLTEDYAKIVDMEEVAERSYDAMEAYLLTQEKADEKLDEAYKKVAEAYKTFAANNNVTLRDGDSKLSRRLADLGRVNTYTNQLYLIYFKSTVQENLLFEKLNKKDINGVEQIKGSLLKYAEEGLSRLDTVKAFKNDNSLIAACRKVLEFHKAEAQNRISMYTDFLIKSDDFEKMKKAFDTKPASKRTKQDVDAYNKAVDEQNKAVVAYNKMNDELNNNRTKVMTNWENTKKRFMDTHYPHKV
jgi:hypothetical protein